MKLGEIYNIAIKKGLAEDPRSRDAVKNALSEARKEYNKLAKSRRKFFDKERLRHPYDDTRILHGNPKKQVRSIMVGIDMEAPELILADRLNEKGANIDLVMAHHPEGRALAHFYNVMSMQVDVLKKFGISADVGKDLLSERMSEVGRAVSAVNHMRAVDVARLLDIPYMCVHTPADNHVMSFLQRLMDKKRPPTLKGVLDLLLSVPEYGDAAAKNAGPYIMIGKEKDKAGKIAVDMTGGTEGSKRVFPRLSQAGVGTIIGMHLSEEHYKSAEKEHINIVIAGHISSDTIGLNLLLDSLCAAGDLDIIPCSGFVRFRRA